jgi:hypothetical protein
MIRRMLSAWRDFRIARNPKSKWILCFEPFDAPSPGCFLNLGTVQGTHKHAMHVCRDVIGLLAITSRKMQAGKYYVRHELEAANIYPVQGLGQA